MEALAAGVASVEVALAAEVSAEALAAAAAPLGVGRFSTLLRFYSLLIYTWVNQRFKRFLKWKLLQPRNASEVKLFDIVLLEEACIFLNRLSVKDRLKIYHVFQVTRLKYKSYYFKKLQADIWEFRLYVDRKYYRLFAFKSSKTIKETVVTVTHGFVKETTETPFKEILKAVRLKRYYSGISKVQLAKETYKLEKLLDEHIGARGTKNRTVFEQQSFSCVLGQQVKEVRKQRALSQVELGNLVGVKKAQISKIENGKSQLRIDTLLSVFNALNAELHFSVRLKESITSCA